MNGGRAPHGEGMGERRITRQLASYTGLGLLLLVYVGLCTGYRDNVWESDAWEHHRVLVALVQDLEQPGNPTFATEHASVRYSPYSVPLALLCRATGLDPYTALGLGGLLNTALLLLALPWLLHAFGEARLATSALIVMLTLYGVAPGYAGSTALADLPWHQVNPSAFAFALALFALGAFARALERARPAGAALATAVLLAGVLLAHGMTGGFAAVGLFAIALARPRAEWLPGLGWAAGSIALAVGLALLWPWYDFLAVVLSPRDDGWFNGSVLRMMLWEWTLPGLLVSACALPWRARPLVRVALLAGGLCWTLGLAATVLRSASLARLPLTGLFFFQVAAAVFVYETRLLQFGSWRARTGRLLSGDRGVAASGLLETLVACALLYGAVPQLWSIAREPHLARPYLAPLLGRPDEQLHLRSRLGKLLAPVGRTDVVLSDPVSSWPVPSLRGRIVTALHQEFFVPDQVQRRADVADFFSVEPTRERTRILERYDVRWILLNRRTLDPRVFEALLDPRAVVGSDGELVLLDVARWRPPEARG